MSASGSRYCCWSVQISSVVVLLPYVDLSTFVSGVEFFQNDLVLNSNPQVADQRSWVFLVPIYPTRIEIMYGVLLIHPGISSTKLLVDRKRSGQWDHYYYYYYYYSPQICLICLSSALYNSWLLLDVLHVQFLNHGKRNKRSLAILSIHWYSSSCSQQKILPCWYFDTHQVVHHRKVLPSSCSQPKVLEFWWYPSSLFTTKRCGI